MGGNTWIYRTIIFLCFLSLGEHKCVLNQGTGRNRNFFVDQKNLPFKIEVSDRISHQLTSNIFKILLKEILGYSEIVLVHQDRQRFPDGDNATRTLQKISNCVLPNHCMKSTTVPDVMINLEVWLSPGFDMESWLSTGTIDDCGQLGPIGRSGWFTGEYTVRHYWSINGTVLDHWRAFRFGDFSAVYDLTADGVLERFVNSVQIGEYCAFEGCDSRGIYRPRLCRSPDVRCATLLADFPASTFKTLERQISQLSLLVNIAWLGSSFEKIVSQLMKEKKNVIFFHKKPSSLSSMYNLTHVHFPDCEDHVELADCYYEANRIEKIAWSKIRTHAPHVFHLLRSMSFEQREYLLLLESYYRNRAPGFTIEDISCFWLKQNKDRWKKWISKDISNKTKLYIGGIFPINGVYWKQRGVIPAAHMAASAINSNKTLLENYTLVVLEQDGLCVADAVMKSFISYVTNSTYKSMVGILGPACSDTVEPIAGVAKYYNTIMISYSAEGVLFNKEKYPYFFRTVPETYQFRHAYLKLFRKFGWQKVAALTEEGQKYPDYVSYLQDSMELNFVVNRKFPKNPDLKPYLEDLKRKGARIIIGEFHALAARAVMCHAFELEMTAIHGYQWFLPVSFEPDWFDTDLHNRREPESVRCSTRQMIEAIDGHMSLAYKYYGEKQAIMQEGKTVSEWYKEYQTLAKVQNVETSRYGGYTYDAVWVYALALDSLLKENSSHISNLHTSRTSRRLVQLLKQTRIPGVTGPLHFMDSSRISDVVIWQWFQNKTREVGLYRPFSREVGILEINESQIIWLTPDGQKPDGTADEVSKACILEGFRDLLGIGCETSNIIANLVGFTVLSAILLSALAIYKRRYERKLQEKLELMGGTLDEWEMTREDIVINRKLGEGAFGTVFGGEARVQDDGWTAVAIKTLKSRAKSEEKLDFLGEAEVMKQFNHTNIVKLIGVCTLNEPFYTVMEFMLYGDLKTYLLSRRHFAGDRNRANNVEVSDRRLTRMAIDVARGLSYLAEIKFVHRDLACRNCLVNANRMVKIADFGMCRAMYSSNYYRYSKKGLLPVRWMAPESIIDGVFTPMSDVWSYGVVLYEIVTFASFPYRGLSNNQVLERIKSYSTLPIPNGCNSELAALLLRIWSQTPKDRPQASHIVEILVNRPDMLSPCLDTPMVSSEDEETYMRRRRKHAASSGGVQTDSGFPKPTPETYDLKSLQKGASNDCSKDNSEITYL